MVHTVNLMNQSPSIRVLPSVCALDCPDACALNIQVDGDKVVGLAGDPSHPITRGFACVKTARYPERQEQADRLMHPLRRVGGKGQGKFERVTWDTALDEIADRLQSILDSHGGQSVLPYHYAGTMGVIQGDSPSLFFRSLGALELDQTICATTGGAAWEANYGPNKIGCDPEDLVHSRYIVLWGINVLRSNSHLAPILKEARKRGAKILHIDPYRNETSRFADEHWQIRVGTDAALALAIGREILAQGWEDCEYLGQFATGLDEYRQACQLWTLQRASEFCDVPLESLQAMVRSYAKSGASFIKVGYGMTRNEGGGNACRAITLLPALIGAWKQLGGGSVLSTSGAFQLNRREITGAHRSKSTCRHVNMNWLDPHRNVSEGAATTQVRQSLTGKIIEAFFVGAEFRPPLTYRDDHALFCILGHHCFALDSPVAACNLDRLAFEDAVLLGISGINQQGWFSTCEFDNARDVSHGRVDHDGTWRRD